MAKARGGFSLLEVVVTTALMATVVTSVTVLLRTSQTTWQAVDSDQTRTEAAHAVIRHIVRHARQAEAVASMSAASDDSGTLSLTMADGSTLVWDHAASIVNFGEDTADSLLAEHIETLNFVGYEADGTTTTETAADVQSILCTVTISLDRDTNATRTVKSWVWMRAW